MTNFIQTFTQNDFGKFLLVLMVLIAMCLLFSAISILYYHFKGCFVRTNPSLPRTKIFISQPMAGKTEEQIRSERDKAVQACLKWADKLLTPGQPKRTISFPDIYHPEWHDEAVASGQCINERVFFLGKSIEILAFSDYAYFAKGWDKADGCRMERAVCKLYQIPIIPEE